MFTFGERHSYALLQILEFFVNSRFKIPTMASPKRQKISAEYENQANGRKKSAVTKKFFKKRIKLEKRSDN